MGAQGSSILIIIVIAVTVIAAAWLIHLIYRIQKMKKAYLDVLKKKQEAAEKQPADEKGPQEGLKEAPDADEDTDRPEQIISVTESEKSE